MRWAEPAANGVKTVDAPKFTFQAEAKDAAVLLLRANRSWSVHARHFSLHELGLDVKAVND